MHTYTHTHTHTHTHTYTYIPVWMIHQNAAVCYMLDISAAAFTATE